MDLPLGLISRADQAQFCRVVWGIFFDDSFAVVRLDLSWGFGVQLILL